MVFNGDGSKNATEHNVTQRMFRVSIEDQKTGGVRIELPVLRTEEQVEQLRRGYENVIAHAVETPGVDDEIPVGFRSALRALIACYKKAESEGDLRMASRAQAAVSALLGYQPHLKGDDGKPVGEQTRATLLPIQGGRK